MVNVLRHLLAVLSHSCLQVFKSTLDGNINQYLTSRRPPDNEFTESEKVTLRRILHHTAGLTVWGFPGYDKGEQVPSTVDVLDGKGNTMKVIASYKNPQKSFNSEGCDYSTTDST